MYYISISRRMTAVVWWLWYLLLITTTSCSPLVTFAAAAAAENKCAVRNISSPADGTLSNQYRPYKLVLSTTSEYLPVLFNWMLYFQSHCPDSFDVLYIMCLDKKIEENLPKYGLKCSFVHYLPNDRWAYNRLWQMRAQVTKELVDVGYDVLLSDSDALWLRNPFPDLVQFPYSDIIATRAKFPEWIHGRIGAAICMGFIYIKSTPLISNFWGEFISTLVRMRNPDDQRMINELVFRKEIKFTRRLKYYNSTDSDTGYFRHQKQNMNITLLPQQYYRRVCESIDPQTLANSTVLHCFTKQKKESSKKNAGKRYGNWKLDSAWTKVALVPKMDIKTFLRQVTLNETSG